MNDERIARACKAILAAYDDDLTMDESVTDLLTDLMHVVDYMINNDGMSRSFDVCLDLARMHYRAEFVHKESSEEGI